MAGLGVGNEIYILRKKVQDLSLQLKSLGELPPDSPKLIDSANLLRKNEFLLKAYNDQKDLICAYEEYAKSLENMLSVVFNIQNDLKDLLKEQTKLLSSENRPKKRKRRTPRK